jgi:hypothetical protein
MLRSIVVSYSLCWYLYLPVDLKSKFLCFQAFSHVSHTIMIMVLKSSGLLIVSDNWLISTCHLFVRKPLITLSHQALIDFWSFLLFQYLLVPISLWLCCCAFIFLLLQTSLSVSYKSYCSGSLFGILCNECTQVYGVWFPHLCYKRNTWNQGWVHVFA